jgi:biotin synthase
MLNKVLMNLTDKILEDNNFHISESEVKALAALPEDETMDLILCASRIRQRYKGNRVFTCSITNAKSGFCTEDCAFCAQSAHHQTGIETYALMSEQDMTADALRLHEGGATEYSMVTSGYALTDQEIETICGAAGKIIEHSELAVCASLGILTEARALRLRESGIRSYHHNLETARSFFDNICTTHDYEEDVQTVKTAKAAGFKVCSGGILGLGESWEQRVEFALILRDLDVDSIPLNFLNPIPGTKLAARPLLPPLEALKCIALFRFINPRKDITICGGREVTLRDLQSWVFTAGANGLMIGNYLTTQGRDIKADMDMIRDLGLVVEKGTQHGR